jgi:hypothetical protein
MASAPVYETASRRLHVKAALFFRSAPGHDRNAALAQSAVVKRQLLEASNTNLEVTGGLPLSLIIRLRVVGNKTTAPSYSDLCEHLRSDLLSSAYSATATESLCRGITIR